MRSQRAVSEHTPDAAIAYGAGSRIEKVFTIAKSADDLYAYWRDFKNLPQTMSHVESVQIIDDLRLALDGERPRGLHGDVGCGDHRRQARRAHCVAFDRRVRSERRVCFVQVGHGGRGTELRVEMECSRRPARSANRLQICSAVIPV